MVLADKDTALSRSRLIQCTGIIDDFTHSVHTVLSYTTEGQCE